MSKHIATLENQNQEMRGKIEALQKNQADYELNVSHFFKLLKSIPFLEN